MTDARVDAFMTGYRNAWESNSPHDVVAIFTPDAVYRGRPGTPA